MSASDTYENLSKLESLFDKQSEYIKQIIIDMIKPHCKCVEIGNNPIYMCNITDDLLNDVQSFVGRKRDFLFAFAFCMAILFTGGLTLMINKLVSYHYETKYKMQ